MAVNEVKYGNDTLINLKEDTVTSNTLVSGYTAHSASGEVITGSLELADAQEVLQSANDYTNSAVESKLDKTGNGQDVTVSFTQSTTRANVSTGEKLSVLFGKISKFFADLKTVAFTGSYNDLSDRPSIPTVGNGTVTIKQAGSSKGTFTLNQSGDTTIELTDNNTTYSNFVKSGSGAKAGLVPAPSTTSGTTKYLREDGTWAEPVANVDTLTSLEEVEASTDVSKPVGAGAVKELNSSLQNVNVYVGTDKKLHFVDSEGADSVLPFNLTVDSYNVSATSWVTYLDINIGTNRKGYAVHVNNYTTSNGATNVVIKCEYNSSTGVLKLKSDNSVYTYFMISGIAYAW